MFRRAPRSFFYAAHVVGTFLRKRQTRSADAWFALLYASTFYPEVHVSLEEWAPEMRHLRVWREMPKRCAPYNSLLQRLARRILTFAGQRKALVDLLEGCDDAVAAARALVAAFEGREAPRADKAFAYAAWFLDDTPFPLVRPGVAAGAGWTGGFDLLPFVCPKFFAGASKRPRRDALWTRVAHFWATWQALRGFPEAFDAPFAMWLTLFEQTSEEARDNILRGRPHLAAAARRVRDAGEARAWTEAPPGVARVGEGLREFFRGNARFEAKYACLRTMHRCGKVHLFEAKAAGAPPDTVAWLRDRESRLMTIIFPSEGEVGPTPGRALQTPAHAARVAAGDLDGRLHDGARRLAQAERGHERLRASRPHAAPVDRVYRRRLRRVGRLRDNRAIQQRRGAKPFVPRRALRRAVGGAFGRLQRKRAARRFNSRARVRPPPGRSRRRAGGDARATLFGFLRRRGQTHEVRNALRGRTAPS